MRKTVHSALVILLAFLLGGCSEYTKLLKSTDYEARYAYAKQLYEKKQYSKALPLFESSVQMFKGTAKAEESLYLVAQCTFQTKDYQSASNYFLTYCKTFPKGEYTELSRFYGAFALYKDSPDARLDQSGTKKAIVELNNFLEYYPKSERADEALKYLYELQEKLCYKELQTVKLYYKLGNYMGNNYQSSIITAQNVLKDYSWTQYREEFMYYIIAAKYEMALKSVSDKLLLRYREVVDEYFNYMSEFPEGKNVKAVTRYYNYAKSQIKEL
jgi:outer membrane protein assembly factor BamD